MSAPPFAPRRILSIARIYFEASVWEYPVGRQIMEQYPDVERIEVASHWKISELHGNEGAVRDWVRNKRTVLVLGVRKSMQARPNGRSADFIAPGLANGCAMACVYCYVPRRKGYANPISLFVNVEQICAYLQRHAARQGPKTQPNQVDPYLWVYDIGENSDCSVDATLCDGVQQVVELFRTLSNAKVSFATKYVNRDLLRLDPQGKTRVRFSLSPHQVARRLDVWTSPVAERIAAINDFVDAGYEVHVNFSPVVLYDGWLEDYRELFRELDAGIHDRARQQLKAEVIFLTHNEPLHQVNLQWHPRAEEMLWTPDMQEKKLSENGQVNVRYKRGLKGQRVRELKELLSTELPYCTVRYAF